MKARHTGTTEDGLARLMVKVGGRELMLLVDRPYQRACIVRREALYVVAPRQPGFAGRVHREGRRRDRDRRDETGTTVVGNDGKILISQGAA